MVFGRNSVGGSRLSRAFTGEILLMSRLWLEAAAAAE